MLLKNASICFCMILFCNIISHTVSLENGPTDSCEVITCDPGDVCLSFATMCGDKPCQQPVCIPARCAIPRKRGRCRARLRRWFFDASVLSCAQFSYTGCRGNRNRFISQHACERNCLLPTRS